MFDKIKKEIPTYTANVYRDLRGVSVVTPIHIRILNPTILRTPFSNINDETADHNHTAWMSI